MNAVASGHPTDLTWLLKVLVENIPHANCAVLTSSDGIPKSAYGGPKDRTDGLAACASTLCSIASGIGVNWSGGGVRQVVVELEGLLFFVSEAGPGSVLAVLTGPLADPNTVGYQMQQLAKQVPAHLGTPSRDTSAATGSW
jgi:predicted regulator of Ras-like GTPase activity (Roadblock/LC7/MglB family)